MLWMNCEKPQVDEKIDESRKHFQNLPVDFKEIANRYLKEWYSIIQALKEVEKFKLLNNKENAIAEKFLGENYKPVQAMKEVNAFRQIQNLVDDDEIKIANRYLDIMPSYTRIMEEIKSFRDIQNLPEDLKIGANKDVLEWHTSIDTLHNIALEDLNEKIAKYPKDSAEYTLLFGTKEKLKNHHSNLPKEYHTPTRALRYAFRHLPEKYKEIYFMYQKIYWYDNHEKALKEALSKREIDNLPEKIELRAKDYIKQGIPPTHALKHALVQEEIDNLPFKWKQKVDEYIKKWLSPNSALNGIKIERKYDMDNKLEKHPL